MSNEPTRLNGTLMQVGITTGSVSYHMKVVAKDLISPNNTFPVLEVISEEGLDQFRSGTEVSFVVDVRQLEPHKFAMVAVDLKIGHEPRK